MATRIEYLRLSSRAYTTLLKHGIETIEEIAESYPDKLREKSGIGKIVFKEIEEALIRTHSIHA